MPPSPELQAQVAHYLRSISMWNASNGTAAQADPLHLASYTVAPVMAPAVTAGVDQQAPWAIGHTNQPLAAGAMQGAGSASDLTPEALATLAQYGISSRAHLDAIIGTGGWNWVRPGAPQ